MSTHLETAQQDLAFMRALAEDDTPLPAVLGAHLLAAGAVWAPVPLFLWADLAHVIEVPNAWLNWSWVPPTILYAVLVAFLLRAKVKTVWGPSKRLAAFAWSAMGMMCVTLLLALAIASTRFDKQILYVWPSVLMSLYGGAWAVIALMRKRASFGYVAAGCFATSLATAWLIATPLEWLTLGIGVILWIACPGAAILLHARAYSKI